ncbi:hypothetical protein BRADI_5g24281v3 [Brachypodium distachyon]|uniref:Uncharacterized protein n=1 Tax=Brachypodium distachyon TaxID=15368 RepID=A0A2K2CJ40_BRADI|nr:hypothetical protein BRADI_5g24281v3 [Brachypodium distachyon]
MGHASIGTPAATASSTEFQPQCVMNHPTAACLSTATCGAHPRTTRPRLTSASKPCGTTSSPAPAPTTHTNGTALSSSASANAAATAWFSTVWLPKQTYTTEPSGKPSSQAPRSPAETAASPPLSPATSFSGASGPTAHTRRNPRSSSGASRYLPSSARSVFDTNPQLSKFQRKFLLTASPT